MSATQKQSTQQQNGTAEKMDDKKSWTRVFKKSSPNGKITVYIGKRDFIDHLTHTDEIDGVVLLDPEYVRNRKVFVHVLAAFRYGREDLDVLGLTFRKDLFHKTLQIYPPLPSASPSPCTSTSTPLPPDCPVLPPESARKTAATRKLTRLQERLLRKLNATSEVAYPFSFELPHSTPASVTLQPAPEDTGKPCGVDYELRAYVADSRDDKMHKRSSVSLAIRKLTYAPDAPAPQPCADTHKEFMMSAGRLRLEATLDKEKYYHGESIHVNVLVDNNTNKSAKRLKISVRQIAEICLFSSATYKCSVAELESEEGFPIHPNQTGWCKVFKLRPSIEENREKQGLALDGKLKHEDTNLASSTILSDSTQKESMGIIVQYRVKVRLYCGFGNGDLSVELPFTLTHPKPQEEPPSPVLATRKAVEKKEAVSSTRSGAPLKSDSSEPQAGSAAVRVEQGRQPRTVSDSVVHDLIDLSADGQQQQRNVLPSNRTNPFNSSSGARSTSTQDDEDDLIFEDFARLRLQGQDVTDLE